MKAIAWDDKPKEYMEMLKEYLLDYHIELDVEEDPDDFTKRFLQKEDEWSFVVLDYVNEKHKKDGAEMQGDENPTGAVLAQKITLRKPQIPIFIITGRLERAALKKDDFSPRVKLKTKNTSPAWMAADIVSDLRAEGLYSHEKRVFLIHGRDLASPDATDKTHRYLENDLGLEVVRINSNNLIKSLDAGLVERMRDCRAVVAVCTPDDQWENGHFYPRLNVVLEIGIAMGLSGSVEKLCLMKREGAERQLTANLPSDLNGLLYISFGEDIEESFGQLKQRLIQMGLKVS